MQTMRASARANFSTIDAVASDDPSSTTASCQAANC
jgi:hypothetical protein